MERESLSLDSRWNCFFAGNDLHTMYDDGLWCLLPSLKTLQAYVEAMEMDDHEYGFYLRDAMEVCSFHCSVLNKILTLHDLFKAR